MGSGGSGFGIFAGGWDQTSTYWATSERYNYQTGAVSSGTSLGTAREGLSASGNATIGIFSQGFTGAIANVTDKYTWAGDIVSAGSVLTGTARTKSSATGNSSVGIFAGGWDHNDVSATVYIDASKYTYSGDTVAAGTSLASARYGQGASGNASIGIFMAGSAGTSGNQLNSTKYTYAGDTVAAGTSLTAFARLDLAATGTPLFGLFTGGNAPPVVSTVDKYTYSSNVITSGTSLAAAHDDGAAAGNATIGVFCAKGATAVSVTSVYTYASDSVAAGTLLSTYRPYLAAASSTPGHF